MRSVTFQAHPACGASFGACASKQLALLHCMQNSSQVIAIRHFRSYSEQTVLENHIQASQDLLLRIHLNSSHSRLGFSTYHNDINIVEGLYESL